MTDRRHVLQAGVVAVVGLTILPGCSDDTPSQEPVATPDPQQADELALIEAYTAALSAAGPRATRVYTQLRDEHVAHLQALGWQGPAPEAASTSRVSRADLIRAERRATRSRTRAAQSAEDAEQAQILALIAASEAQHAATLEAL